MPDPAPKNTVPASPELPLAGVGAIVVAYHPDADTLDALLHTLLPEVEWLVLVDNGGGKGFLQNHPEAREQVHYLPQKGNIGLGAALNVGLTYLHALKCRYAALFHHDSAPPAGMLASLLDHHAFLLQQGIPCAAVGPRQRRGKRLVPLYQQRGAFLRKVPVHHSRAPVHEVDVLPSSGMMVNMRAWKAKLEFNASLFVDHTDTDWCFRARELGYHVYASLQTEMPAAAPSGDPGGESPTRPQPSPLQQYYRQRNALHLLRQPYVPRGWKRRLLRGVLRRLLASAFTRSDGHQPRHTMAALRDGFFGILGPCPFAGDGQWPPKSPEPQARKSPD